MIRNVELAREALRMALRLRRSAGSDASSPICVFDSAARRGTKVKFAAIGSMEGMYVQAAKPVIIVPSQRPPGRQAFACAHEMGHHQFGHGSHIDEWLSDGAPHRGSDAKERIADLFAAQLLMPKAAVLRAFRRRGCDVVTPRPEQVFTVAGQLGVGYLTLIKQLRDTHQLNFKPARRTTAKTITQSTARVDAKTSCAW